VYKRDYAFKMNVIEEIRSCIEILANGMYESHLRITSIIFQVQAISKKPTCFYDAAFSRQKHPPQNL